MITADVIYHYEDGTWWAESPEVPRWSVAAETFEETKTLAEEGIPFATDRDDWQLRHVVSAELVPYVLRATAGVMARVTLKPLLGFAVASEALPAGVHRRDDHAFA